MTPLLTPENVADLLQIDAKTVYKHSRRLGGFYPAGIKVLRFKQETINDIMEGGQRVAVQFQAPKKPVLVKNLLQQNGSCSRDGRPQESSKKSLYDKGEDRFNLFGAGR